MYKLDDLRRLKNKELFDAYEAACFSYVHKPTNSNAKAIDRIERVIRERMKPDFE